MTKKDYIQLTIAIRATTRMEFKPQAHYVLDREPFLESLCTLLKQDNPRFDKEKFLDACTPTA